MEEPETSQGMIRMLSIPGWYHHKNCSAAYPSLGPSSASTTAAAAAMLQHPEDAASDKTEKATHILALGANTHHVISIELACASCIDEKGPHYSFAKNTLRRLP